jgi:hypothetical protein
MGKNSCRVFFPGVPFRPHGTAMRAARTIEAFFHGGTSTRLQKFPPWRRGFRRKLMHGLIYLVGLIVVIMAILSFFGLR